MIWAIDSNFDIVVFKEISEKLRFSFLIVKCFWALLGWFYHRR